MTSRSCRAAAAQMGSAFRRSELYPLTPSVMAAPGSTISLPVIPLRSLQAPV